DSKRLATAGRDYKLRLWDVETGQELVTLSDSSFRGLEFSPGGQRAAGEANSQLRIWEAEMPEPVLHHLEAYQFVVQLFRDVGTRAEVLQRLRADPQLPEGRRQAALRFAETYPENPYALNQAAWAAARPPQGAPASYQAALQKAQAACRMQPNNPEL